MAYTPPVVKSKYDGPQGLAKLKVSEDKKKVMVLMKEPEVKAVVLTKNCPDGKVPPSGEWMVQLSEDKTELLRVSPSKGMFNAKFKEFPAPEGQDPAPKTKNATYEGNSWSYEYFIAILELVGGDVDGMTVPLMLRYHFGEAEQEIRGKMLNVVAYTHPKSKYTPMTIEFCELTGVWESGPIKYTDNILPELEKRILRADKTFQIVMKDGWIVNLLGAVDLEEEDAPWDENSEE